MNKHTYIWLVLLATSALSGCGGGSTSTVPAANPPPAAVKGIDTPKSVSAVTAN